MTHYIIQDAYTGYIWGDTRNYANGPNVYASIIDACCALDEDNEDFGRAYEEVSQIAGDTGYLVYQVTVDGSEAVTVVDDGQDRTTIAAVENDCNLVGYVQWANAEKEAE